MFFLNKKTHKFPEDKDRSDIDSDRQESELVEIPAARASSTLTTLLSSTSSPRVSSSGLKLLMIDLKQEEFKHKEQDQMTKAQIVYLDLGEDYGP